MEKLITVTAAEDVTDDYKKEAKTWTKWDSKNRKKFPYNYKQEERVLILSGSATLTPIIINNNNGNKEDGDPIVIDAGMSVIFHVGFQCKWHVTKRMKKHYAMFGAAAEEEEEDEAITCDVCSKGCVAESYFVKDEEMDICPACFEKGQEEL